MTKADQIRALRELRHAKRAPNPFEDAARGRDPIPNSKGGSHESRLTTKPVRSTPVEKQQPKTSEIGTERPQPAGRKVRAPDSSQASQRGNVPDNKRALKGNRETRESPKRGRGRPKITEQRPWEAAGISRAQWYRRQKSK